MKHRDEVSVWMCVLWMVLRLAEASEGGRICFMRVIDALLQEKRAKQAWNCAGDQIRIEAYGGAEGEQQSLAAQGWRD